MNLVEKVMTQLEGTFAIVVKSAVFPNQLVAARRGSPLLLGAKSSSSATLDHIPVYNQQMKSGNRGHLLKTGQLAAGRIGFFSLFDKIMVKTDEALAKIIERKTVFCS